jgi:hypothetical protein
MYHSAHVWADANPHVIVQGRFQSRFSINLWAGILDGKIVSPFELPQRINGRRYLRFLRTDFPRLLPDVMEGMVLERLDQVWFLHDGASPHFSRNVRDYLNRKYPNRWIGRNGPIRWPSRSLNLIPLSFILGPDERFGVRS